MRKMKWLSIGVLAVFIAIQFIGAKRPNPPVDETRTLEATARLTPEAASVIRRACMDCHSHETRWPWYSYVAPVSWYVIDHVNEGRRHLNFSEWAQYDLKRVTRKLGEIREQTENREMPLKSYLLLHPSAQLSVVDIDAVRLWASDELQRLPVQSPAH